MISFGSYMFILYLFIVLFLAYAVLVLYYGYNWRRIPFFTGTNTTPSTSVTIIIPARNEEQHIGKLLSALKQQNFPAALLEIIVVDDHSTDNTATIVEQFPEVKLIKLEADNINSYKKKAIETGVAAARGSFIITTDADCIPRENWLRTIIEFKENNNSVLVVAPVSINCNSSFVQLFQAIDFMVLQGITGSVVHHSKLSMCNGANLGYEKNAFYQVHGFSGIDSIASGDDMLLMYKISKEYPGRVSYLKSTEAIVSTQPMNSWKDFFNQRIRWASKAGKYQDKRLFPVLLLVYLFNVFFLVLLVTAFIDPRYWLWLAGAWLLKTVVELPLFTAVARFFDKQRAIKLFFFFQPFHIIYTIIAGLFGQFGKYEWKGRRVR